MAVTVRTMRTVRAGLHPAVMEQRAGGGAAARSSSSGFTGRFTLIMASNCMEMGSVDSTVESSSLAPCGNGNTSLG